MARSLGWGEGFFHLYCDQANGCFKQQAARELGSFLSSVTLHHEPWAAAPFSSLSLYFPHLQNAFN